MSVALRFRLYVLHSVVDLRIGRKRDAWALRCICDGIYSLGMLAAQVAEPNILFKGYNKYLGTSTGSAIGSYKK